MRTEDQIGYGKPPKKSQWQPGQSGNPSGKKKGAPKKEAQSFQDTLAILLQETIMMTIDGKKQKVSLGEVLARKILNNLMHASLKQQVESLKQLAGMGAIDIQNIWPGHENSFFDPFTEYERRLLKITQDELNGCGLEE